MFVVVNKFYSASRRQRPVPPRLRRAYHMSQNG